MSELAQQQTMDFIYHDFGHRRGGRSHRIPDDTMRLHWKLNNKSICLNEKASDKIRESKFTHVRVREDRYTGKIVLVFNSELGLRLNPKRLENPSLTIDGIDITRLIATKCLHKPTNDVFFTLDITIHCIFESDEELVFDIDKECIYQVAM